MADKEQLVTENAHMEGQIEAREAYPSTSVNPTSLAPQDFPHSASVAPAPRNNTASSMKLTYVHGIGIAQIVLGILSFLLQIIPCVYSDRVAAGIWCGIYFIVTGSFGIATSKSRSKCLMITSMILNIVSAAMFVPMLLGFTIFGIVQTSYGWFEHSELQIPSFIGYGLILGMDITIMIISIISSYFWARAACAMKPYKSVMVQYATGDQPMMLLPSALGQQQVLYNAQGQPVMVSMVPQQFPMTPAPPVTGSPPQANTIVPSQAHVA